MKTSLERFIELLDEVRQTVTVAISMLWQMGFGKIDKWRRLLQVSVMCYMGLQHFKPYEHFIAISLEERECGTCILFVTVTWGHEVSQVYLEFK